MFVPPVEVKFIESQSYWSQSVGGGDGLNLRGLLGSGGAILASLGSACVQRVSGVARQYEFAGP